MLVMSTRFRIEYDFLKGRYAFTRRLISAIPLSNGLLRALEGPMGRPR